LYRHQHRPSPLPRRIAADLRLQLPLEHAGRCARLEEPVAREHARVGSTVPAAARQLPRPATHRVPRPVRGLRAPPPRARYYVPLTKPRVVMMVLVTTLVGYYLGSDGTPSTLLHLLHTLLGTALAAGGTLAGR